MARKSAKEETIEEVPLPATYDITDQLLAMPVEDLLDDMYQAVKNYQDAFPIIAQTIEYWSLRVMHDFDSILKRRGIEVVCLPDGRFELLKRQVSET